jgi:cobalt/nickel transport system permease protein
MHNLLDDYAHSNALRDVSSSLKLFLAFSSILICIFSTSPVVPLFIAFSMGFIIVAMAKISLRIYAKLLLVPLSFALMSTLAIIFVQGETPLFTFTIFDFSLSIKSEGIELALLLLSRTLGGMSALFFIALTTPMIEIFSILKSFGLPELLMELSMLIYRYIFLLLDEATMIHNAQTMRMGNLGLRSSLKSFSMLSSVLFLRAWEQGERLMIAMDYGRLEVMDDKVPPSKKVTAAILSYLAVLIIIAVFTKDMSLL